MGINPTPTNHRSFTYDGKSTREFGVYITGKDVFNAPERAVEMISIPGRDGEYALDQGHFNNIEVTYRAGIVADSTTDFAEAISNFRNWLASREGYCRLTDEYNTEEYRMAVFKNAIALEHEGLLTGEFDVTFDCKPQRFLAIGEELTEIGAWGNTETAEGDIVTIDANSDTAVKALTADIDPIQDLHGYDAPWVGGAGKNKSSVNELTNIGWASSNADILASMNTLSEGTYTLSFDVKLTSVSKTGAWQDGIILINSNGTVFKQNNIATDPTVGFTDTVEYTFTLSASQVGAFTACYVYGCGSNGQGEMGKATLSNIQIESGNQKTSFAPYENICPISGHDEVTVTVADDVDNPTVSEDYTTTLPSTTYGGTLDVVSGVLTVDRAGLTLDGSEPWVMHGSGSAMTYAMRLNLSDFKFVLSTITAWSSYLPSIDNTKAWGDYDTFISMNVRGIVTGIRSITTVADWKTYLASNPLQVVYVLKEPQTYQLTPQQIELLLGENHIFADSGNVTVEYGHNPTLLTNPTWFPSKPLLAVEGYGTIGFNGYEIEIDSGLLGDVVLSGSVTANEITIDESNLNAGDGITVQIGDIKFAITLPHDTSIDYNSQRISDSISDSNSDFATVYDSQSIGISSSDIWYHTSVQPVEFTSGTSATISNTVTGTINCKARSTPSFTVTFSLTQWIKYTASTHKLLITWVWATVSTTASHIVDPYIFGTTERFISVVGHSTKSSLGDPTYIDCDLGECYLINDGSVVSLNHLIDLGSDLPTLPSGDTEVTYDNTITKVEVKPNWWKV